MQSAVRSNNRTLIALLIVKPSINHAMFDAKYWYVRF